MESENKSLRNVGIFTKAIVRGVVIALVVIVAWKIYDKLNRPDNQEQSIIIPTQDTVGLLRSSIANIQSQGKLVVMSMDVQSIQSGDTSGIMSRTAITTIATAKVQFTMNLKDIDPNWVSVKDQHILVVLPKDFVKVEMVSPHETIEDHSNWLATDEDKRIMLDNNRRINNAQMMTQANGMLELARPNAAYELESLFKIPLKTISPDVTVTVTFG